MKNINLQLFCLYLFLFWVNISMAQDKAAPAVDSLIQRADQMLKKGGLGCDSVASMAIEKALSINDPQLLAKAYTIRGTCGWMNMNHYHRRSDLPIARDIYRQLGDSLGVIETLIQEGTFARITSKFNQALELYSNALQITESTFPANYKKLAHINSVLGNVYKNINNNKQALYHYNKSTSIPLAAKDTLTSLKWSGNKAYFLIATDTLLEEAVTMLNRLLLSERDSLAHSIAHLQLAISYYKMKNYESAIFHANKVINYDLNNYNSLFRLGVVYSYRGLAQQALQFPEEAQASIDAARKFHDSTFAPHLQHNKLYFENLLTYYTNIHDYKRLSETLQAWSMVKDSIHEASFSTKLADAVSEHDGYLKDQEIKYLNLEKEKNKSQRQLLLLGFIALGLFLLTLLYAIYRQRLQQKIVEDKNENISHLLSEKEHLLNSLKQTQDQLIRQEKLATIGQLTAGVAHEINNPINYIQNNSKALDLDIQDLNKILDLLIQLIQSENPDTITKLIQESKAVDLPTLRIEIEKLLSGIKGGSARIATIVQSLKYLAFTDKGSTTVTNIEQPIEASLAILSNNIQNHITVRKHFGKCKPIAINASQISQVILNILNNALQSITASGNIEVTTICESSLLTIQIKDSGCGMSDDTKQRIFEPFFTTKEIGRGTGLGLSISYGIVKAHNGDITVESEPGKGSIFTITLPYHE